MKIKIPLSKEQYISLVKVIYLGEWLVNSHRIPPDWDKEMDDISSYILSYANGFESDDLLQYDKTLNKTFPTRKLEEMLQEKYVDEHNNEVFWDELTGRLANRDFRNKYTEKEIAEMDTVKRIIAIEDIMEKYDKEFVENGLENVIVNINQNK